MADLLKTEDVAASLFDHLQATLDGVYVHRPGEAWDGKPEEWAEVRITRVERDGMSRRGEESYPVVIAVTCFSRRGRKGGKFKTLDAFCDKVRPAFDSTALAKAIKVRDEGKRVVAILDFGPAVEARTYNVAVDVDGVSHPGTDVATISVRCVLSRSAHV